MRYVLEAGRLRPASSSAPHAPATGARARGATPVRRARRPDRFRCRASSCSFVTWSYAAAERHADEHGGARIEVALEVVEAAS